MALKLGGGKYYLNGRGDLFGPMDEFAPGIWMDQYNTWYMPDGRQMNHVESSTGNLVRQACPWCRGRGYGPGDPEGAPIEECQHCKGTGK